MQASKVCCGDHVLLASQEKRPTIFPKDTTKDDPFRHQLKELATFRSLTRRNLFMTHVASTKESKKLKYNQHNLPTTRHCFLVILQVTIISHRTERVGRTSGRHQFDLVALLNDGFARRMKTLGENR